MESIDAQAAEPAAELPALPVHPRAAANEERYQKRLKQLFIQIVLATPEDQELRADWIRYAQVCSATMSNGMWRRMCWPWIPRPEKSNVPRGRQAPRAIPTAA